MDDDVRWHEILRQLESYPTFEDSDEGRDLKADLDDLSDVATTELQEMVERLCTAAAELSDNPHQPFTKTEQEVLDELLHILCCRLNIS